MAQRKQWQKQKQKQKLRDTMAEKLANPWQDKSIRFGFIAASSENKGAEKKWGLEGQAKESRSKENQIK